MERGDQVMEKVIKDGKVAVLYSPGYGAGWSTWAKEAYRETLCMDARLVNLVLANDRDAAGLLAMELCPDVHVGGADDLAVYWIRQGHQFKVDEHDGNEWVQDYGVSDFMIA
jgi:hypothetical protein